MGDELLDNFIDRAAVTDDKQFFLDAIGQIMSAYDKLNAIKITLAGANSMSDIVNGANEAKKAVDSLTTSTDKLLKSEALAAKVAKDNATTKLAQAKAAQVAAKSTIDKAKADQLEAKALKDLAAAEKLEAGAKKELAAETKLIAQARKENAAAALKEQQLNNSSARQKEKQQLDEIGRAYKDYSNAAREATLRAKSYAISLGENDPQTKAAVKAAKDMNDTLKRVDASVGQFGRSVGDYKSGFSGLSNSIAQVSRELPSLAVSVQTFALAISNNLPMVFDEVKRTGAQLKELKAQGEQVPSMFKTVLKSALSFNVGLSIGIALVTAYAGKIADWVTELFSSSAALMKAAEAQQELNDAKKQAIETEKAYQSLLNNEAQDTVVKAQKDELELARARGASEKEILQIERDIAQTRLDRARLNYIQDTKAFGQSFGGSEEQLKKLKTDLDKSKALYQDFLKTGRAFGKEYTKGSEDYQKADTLLKNSFDFQALLYNEQAAKIAEFYEAQRDLRVKDTELAKYNAEQRLSFFADPIQRQQELLEKLSSFEEFGAKQQIKFAEQAAQKQKQIVEGQYDDDIFAAKNNDIKIKELARKRAFDLQVIDEELEKRRIEIRAASLVRQRELDRENIQLGFDEAVQADENRVNSQIEAAQLLLSKRQKETAKGQQIEIKALNDGYNKAIEGSKEGSKKRQKIDEQYAAKRAEIEYSYAVAELKSQIDFAEQYIKIWSAAGYDVTENEKELSKLRMQLSDLETQHLIDNKAKEGKAWRERLEEVETGLGKIKDLNAGVTNFISDMLAAGIESQKQQIEKQIEDIDLRKQAEIDAINASADSDEEKRKKTEIAEKKAAAQKAQLERQQAQLEERRARFDKAANIGRIAIETALAVVHQLSSGDPFTATARAIAAGAIGAAQLAVAIATPIPKFKHGRDGGPETFAIVGDGGVPEVVASPDLKQAYKTPSSDTLTYLQKDWKVFPNMKAFEAAAAGMAGVPELSGLPMLPNNNADVVHALKRGFGTLKETVLNKQENHFYYKNGEMIKAAKKAQQWTIYLNSNL
jgi:hypothetical protein